jgi:ribonuclease R
MVHRLLRKVLHREELPSGLHTRLAVLAKSCTDTEQAATEAERENDRWKTCMIMKTKIGHRFDGRIQGFSLKVAFVRLDSPFLEVGVPLGALGGTFTVDPNRTRAVGQGANVVLSIGDRVKVEITGVDEDLRRVSAWVVEAAAQDSKGKVRSFVPNLATPVTLREADFMPEERRGRQGRDRAPRDGARPGRPADRGPRPERTGRPPERVKPPKGSVRGSRVRTAGGEGPALPKGKRRKG